MSWHAALADHCALFAFLSLLGYRLIRRCRIGPQADAEGNETMTNAFSIPAKFTACEAYRGFVIAVCWGSYVAFRDGARFADANGIAYRRDSREQMRRSIDAMLDQGVVA